MLTINVQVCFWAYSSVPLLCISSKLVSPLLEVGYWSLQQILPSFLSAFNSVFFLCVFWGALLLATCIFGNFVSSRWTDPSSLKMSCFISSNLYCWKPILSDTKIASPGSLFFTCLHSIPFSHPLAFNLFISFNQRVSL